MCEVLKYLQIQLKRRGAELQTAVRPLFDIDILTYKTFVHAYICIGLYANHVHIHTYVNKFCIKQ